MQKLREMAREFTEAFNHGAVDRIMRYYGDVYIDVNLRSPVQSHGPGSLLQGRNADFSSSDLAIDRTDSMSDP